MGVFSLGAALAWRRRCDPVVAVCSTMSAAAVATR